MDLILLEMAVKTIPARNAQQQHDQPDEVDDDNYWNNFNQRYPPVQWGEDVQYLIF